NPTTQDGPGDPEIAVVIVLVRRFQASTDRLDIAGAVGARDKRITRHTGADAYCIAGADRRVPHRSRRRAGLGRSLDQVTGRETDEGRGNQEEADRSHVPPIGSAPGTRYPPKRHPTP